jgi:hypothetical protein
VTVIPAHAVVLTLVLVLAWHDLEHFALAAGLADMRAFHDDPVTRFSVHGEPPFRRSAPPSLYRREALRAGDAVSSGSPWVGDRTQDQGSYRRIRAGHRLTITGRPRCSWPRPR